jgi:hypothetical protein
MWFAAMPGAGTPGWLVRLVSKLLAGDAGARGLLAPGPFESQPPRWIRARYYRYRFTGADEQGWWRRTLVGESLPPLSSNSPLLADYLSLTEEW